MPGTSLIATTLLASIRNAIRLCRKSSIRRSRLNAPHFEKIEDRLAPALVAWDGGGGDLDWNTPTNWSTDLLPTSADDVQISIAGTNTILYSAGTSAINSLTSDQNLSIAGGSISVATTSTVAGSLALSAGTLAGSGNLLVGGLTTWSGGTIAGSGQLNANGGLLLSGGTKIDSGKPVTFLVGATWSAGNIAFESGATLAVPAGLIFDVQTNSTMTHSTGTATINNAGIFQKSAGTGTTNIATGISFNNTNLVDVQVGTLSLGGVTSGSSFTVAAGATLGFGSGTSSLTAPSSVTGGGNVQFSGGNTTIAGTFIPTGNYTINGGTATFNVAVAPSVLTLSSGTLTGPANISIAGLMTWSGGTLSGSGQLFANGGLLLSGNTKTWAARPLSFLIGANWTAGSIAMSGATLDVPAGLVFDATGNSSITGSGTINVAGIFRKSSGTANTTIASSIAFSNNNLVEVQTGTLSIPGTTNTKAFTVAAGSTLEFIGGINDLTAASSVTGPGSVQFSAGTSTVSGTFTPGGTLTVAGATANINVDVAPGGLVVSSGTLSGTGNITVSGVTTWSGGAISGGGQINALGGIVLSGNAKTWSGKPLVFGVGAVWTGGSISMTSTSVLNIPVGLVFDAQTDGDISRNGSGTATVNNAGVFRKSGGTGTTAISSNVSFSGAGTVEIQVGILSLRGTTNSSGSFTVATGAVLRFESGTHNLTAANSVSGGGGLISNGATTSISGTVALGGALQVNGGTATLNGPTSSASLTLNSGTLTGVGTVNVSGPTYWSFGTISGAAFLNANGGVVFDQFSTVSIAVRTLVIGANSTCPISTISMSAGAKISIATGVLFDVQGDLAINLSPAVGTASIDNAGTFRRSTGTGTTSVASGISFNNSGALELTTGNLNLFGGGTSSGSFSVAAGCTLSFAGNTVLTASSSVTGAGTVKFAGTATIAGYFSSAGPMSITSGTINFDSDVTFTSLTLSNATLGGTGNINVTGTTSFINESITGSGILTAGGGLTISTGNHIWQGKTISFGVSASWNSNNITMSAGAILYVPSNLVFSDQGHFSFLGTGTINNVGTFRKSNDGGTLSIASGITFNNSGVLDVQAGIASLSGGGTSTGTFTASSGQTIDFSGGTHLLASSSSIGGAGNVKFSGGSTVADGSLPIAGVISVTGGTLTLNHDCSFNSFAVSGGTLTGTGHVSVSGLFTWTGGTLTGSGQFSANGGFALNGDATINGKPFVFAGGATAGPNSASLSLTNGTTFTIAAGTIFNISSRFDFKGFGTIVNEGVLRNSAANYASFNSGVLLINSGIIEVLLGTIQIYASTSSGSFTIAPGGTLEFNGGPNAVLATADIVNDGTLKFVFGNAVIDAEIGNPGTIDVSLATVTFNAHTTCNNLLLNGEVYGLGTIDVAGLTTWTGYSVYAGGPLNANGGLLLSGTGNARALWGRTLNAGGHSFWTAGAFNIQQDAALIVPAGALFDIQVDSSLAGTQGTGAGAFTNFGTLRKTAGTGVTAVTTIFNNQGVVEVQSGSLSILGNANSTSTGTFAVSSGKSLNFGNGVNTLAATSSVTGTGTVAFVSGTANVFGTIGTGISVSITGAAEVNFESNVSISTLLVSHATLSGNGAITVNGVSNLTAANLSGNGQLNASGGLIIGPGSLNISSKTLTFGIAATSSGSNSISISAGGVLKVPAGLVFTQSGDSQFTGSNGFFINDGTFRKNGSENLSINVGEFDNSGFIELNGGTTTWQCLGSSSGNLAIGAGAIIDFQSSNYAMTAESNLSGSGTVKINSGSVTFSGGGIFAGNVYIGNAIATFDGNVTLGALQATTFCRLIDNGIVNVSGTAWWQGGPWSGTGQFNASGGLLLSDFSHDLIGLTLSAAGGSTWSSGTIRLESGAVFNIPAGAMLDALSTANISRINAIGTATINVMGTFRQSSGSTTVAASIAFNNLGTVDVLSGKTVSIADLGNFASNTLTGGTYLVGGTLKFGGANIVTNAAIVNLIGSSSAILNSSNNANALANFSANASAGVLTLQNSRNLSVPGSFTNAGIVSVFSGTTFSILGGNYLQVSGTTAVNGTIDPSGAFALQGGLISGTGTVAAPVIGTSGAVSPGSSTGILNIVGDVSLAVGASFAIELMGATVGTGYDQLLVMGAVNLGSATLSPTLGFASSLGQSFTVIGNDSVDPVIGTFAGLPEGAIFGIGGLPFVVSYIGGTGNDVVLTRVASFDLSSPVISNLYLDGSSWAPSFRAAAGNSTYGYPAQSGTGQLIGLPWSTVDTIHVQFSENVIVDQIDLGLRGLNVANYAIAGFSYDTVSFIASWTLAGNLDTDRLIVDLDGDTASAVTDISGNKLAGSWTEAVSTFPSSGPSGQDFKYRFVVAVGDADRNGLVRNPDTNMVRAKLFIDAGQAGYNMFADIDGNGQVRNADLNAVRSHLFIDPPAGPGPNRPVRGGVDGSNRNQHSILTQPLREEHVSVSRSTVTPRRLPSALKANILDALFDES